MVTWFIAKTAKNRIMDAQKAPDPGRRLSYRVYGGDSNAEYSTSASWRQERFSACTACNRPLGATFLILRRGRHWHQGCAIPVGSQPESLSPIALALRS